MSRKVLCLVLVLIMALPLLSTLASAEASAEPVEITAVWQINPEVQLTDNPVIKAIEEKLNIKLKIEAPPLNNYGDRVKMAFAFAELLNQEALALQADGVDIVQFDEPAFNVYMAEAADWGVKALERAAQGLTCKTAVHICYGYGISANVQWKQTLGEQWRQYEQVFPALAASCIDQVSLECFHSKVPAELMALLQGKDVMVGVIDVASDVVETAEEVAHTIEGALKYVPRERLIACTNCGLAPMSRAVAEAKLKALADGARLARERAHLRP